MGPPAGSRCSPTFMSECCGFSESLAPEEMGIHLQQHFAHQEVCNASNVSRAQLRKDENNQDKKIGPKAESEQPSEAASHKLRRSNQTQQILELEFAKEQRLGRQVEIERITFLIDRVKRNPSAHCSPGCTLNDLYLMLDNIYLAPLPSLRILDCFSSPSLASGSSSATFTSPAASGSSVKQIDVEESSRAFNANISKFLFTAADEVRQSFPVEITAESFPVEDTAEFLPVETTAEFCLVEDSNSDSDHETDLKEEVLERRRLILKKKVLSKFDVIMVSKGCVFECFVAAFKKSKLTFQDELGDHQFDVKTLREFCAEEFLRVDGKFDEWSCHDEPEFSPEDGVHKFAKIVQTGSGDGWVPEDVIFVIIAHLFKLTVSVHHESGLSLCESTWRSFKFDSDESPTYVDGCPVEGGRAIVELFMDDSKDRPTTFSLLSPKRDEFELTSSGTEDDDASDSIGKCSVMPAPAPPPPPGGSSTATRESIYAKYEKAMESFSSIEWNVDVHRKSTPDSGSGIFALRDIPADVCIALYQGNVVDSAGNIVIECPHTKSLFAQHPLAIRPFSASHCATIMSRREEHMVDGSHHACTTFDSTKDRSNLPWGALLNSSITSFSANCKIKWFPSPHFASHRTKFNKSDHVGFIYTKRLIRKREQFLWKYSVAQWYRTEAESDSDSSTESLAIAPTRALYPPSPLAPALPQAHFSAPAVAPKRVLAQPQPPAPALPPAPTLAASLPAPAVAPKRALAQSRPAPPVTPPAPTLPASLPAPAVAPKRALAQPQLPSAFRCEGCECISPCASLKNCLTPQLFSKKRGILPAPAIAPKRALAQPQPQAPSLPPAPTLPASLPAPAVAPKRALAQKRAYHPAPSIFDGTGVNGGGGGALDPAPPALYRNSKHALAQPQLPSAFRCEGCECISPCASLKNCLTPQLFSKKRGSPDVALHDKENSRCDGCKCLTPCPTLKNCLTPQNNLYKRLIKPKF